MFFPLDISILFMVAVFHNAVLYKKVYAIQAAWKPVTHQLGKVANLYNNLTSFTKMLCMVGKIKMQ